MPHTNSFPTLLPWGAEGGQALRGLGEHGVPGGHHGFVPPSMAQVSLFQPEGGAGGSWGPPPQAPCTGRLCQGAAAWLARAGIMNMGQVDGGLFQGMIGDGLVLGM